MFLAYRIVFDIERNFWGEKMKKVWVLISITLALTFSLYSCSINRVVASLGEGAGTYNGSKYTFHGFQFEKDKYLGENVNGFNLYSVKNDSLCNFLVVIGDNTDCYVKDGCEVPKSGEVTAVFSNYKVTYNHEAIEKFKQISTYSGKEYTFKTDNLANCGREFWFAYNNCPVADGYNYIGYVVYTDNKWMFLNIKNYFSGRNASISGGTFSATIITDKNLTDFLEKGIIDIRPASYK
jgi:hypothetical protein